MISASPFRSLITNETVLAVRNWRGVVFAKLSSLQTERRWSRSETGQRVSLVSESGCNLQTGVSRLASSRRRLRKAKTERKTLQIALNLETQPHRR